MNLNSWYSCLLSTGFTGMHQHAGFIEAMLGMEPRASCLLCETTNRAAYRSFTFLWSTASWAANPNALGVWRVEWRWFEAVAHLTDSSRRGGDNYGRPQGTRLIPMHSHTWVQPFAATFKPTRIFQFSVDVSNLQESFTFSKRFCWEDAPKDLTIDTLSIW